MANYALSINSTFQPFSYQELVAPVAHQQQVFDTLSEQYDKLSAQADVLEAMGSNDRDKNSSVYNRYKSYSDSLRKEADDLYRFGLNSESRRKLSDLRRRYNTEIVPIQNAWNKREEEAKMQLDASLKNPSLMFTRDAQSTSLDEYIKNPQGGFGVINGANIAAQMGAMAKNLEKQVRSGYRQNIDDYTYRYIEQHGLDANMIRDWKNNPTLRAMFEQVMSANGVTPEALAQSPNLQSIIDKSTGYAEMGMWNAMGEDKSQMIEDYGARLNAQAAKEMQVYNAKKAVDAAYAGASGEGYESTLSDSMYQLPMQGADYSNVKEQAAAMKNLGYARNKEGKLVYTGKAQVGDNTYSLYGRDGKLLSRKQFVDQGKNNSEREALQRYYSKVEEASQIIGVSGSDTHKDVTKKYNTLVKSGAAHMANVRALNYEKGDWNATSKNYPVREIKEYRQGKPVYDTKEISLGELLNKQDSNKKDINIAPYWSEVGGQEGLILATTEDGKPHRYFISADSMPESNIRDARQYFKLAEAYRQRGATAEAQQALEIAYRALHTGLTVHNKAYDQQTVRQPSLKQQGLSE